jgi:hypothetical protein
MVIPVKLAQARTSLLARNGSFPKKFVYSLSNTFRSALSSTEKGNYTSAVKCLASKPAKTPTGLAAGAKNRYDDFVATHINQTLSIHGTVSLYSFQILAFVFNIRRVIFSAGTVTSLGSTSKHSVTSVVTPATSHTTTGQNGPVIPPNRLPSMAVLPV